MTTKSFKDAISSIARPEVRGIGKSLTSDPGAECCPICWSKDYIFIAHHWEFDAEILISISETYSTYIDILRGAGAFKTNEDRAKRREKQKVSQKNNPITTTNFYG